MSEFLLFLLNRKKHFLPKCNYIVLENTVTMAKLAYTILEYSITEAKLYRPGDPYADGFVLV